MLQDASRGSLERRTRAGRVSPIYSFCVHIHICHTHCSDEHQTSMPPHAAQEYNLVYYVLSGGPFKSGLSSNCPSELSNLSKPFPLDASSRKLGAGHAHLGAQGRQYIYASPSAIARSQSFWRPAC